jgi:hypothetical protein
MDSTAPPSSSSEAFYTNVNLGVIAVYKQNENFLHHFDQTHTSYLEFMKKMQEENELMYRRVLAGYMEPLAEDIAKMHHVLAALVKANNTMIEATRQFSKELLQQSLEYQLVAHELKEERRNLRNFYQEYELISDELKEEKMKIEK